ncbi:MAG: hypothetical protein ACRC9R_09480, partial [Enterovibrio sp.]
CLEPNADSGLSSLSVVQMLAATLRASQHQVIRDQIDEILNSHAAGRFVMVQMLDRTHEDFLQPSETVRMLASPIAATANRQIKSFTHAVLEICKLALSELQLSQGASPQT